MISVTSFAGKAAVLVLGLLCLALPLSSQTESEQERDQVETFKVSVDVVNLFFNVKEKKNGPLVANLPREEFEVLEDGKPQVIKYYSAESNQPLTLGILLDTSPSQQYVLGMEKDVGAAFLRSVLREKDLAFVLNFDESVTLLQDFTNSPRQLREGLETARINSGGRVGSLPGLGGGPFPQLEKPCCTTLYDAIYLAAEEKLRNEVGRKGMIILTDGYDSGSKTKLRDAVEAAQKADAMCYVLLIADRANFPAGDREMRQLTEQTGGRVIEVGDDEKKLRKAFDEISAELRSQYSIGYSPTNKARDGSFRKVEIRSKKGYYIQARKGYYAPAK